MMLFCKFLVTAVTMAILFLYCFSNCDFVGIWQHFIFFLDLYINIFVGSLHSKPLHGLELTSFSTIPGNKYCHGNTFLLFLGLINNFMGSLPSITLHRLELISFSAIPGNNC